MSLQRPLSTKDLLPKPEEVLEYMKANQVVDLMTARRRVINRKALEALNTNLTVGDLRLLLRTILSENML